jgi:ABC-type cobalamin/Fe3+-siderophores transport system ATPase subunit
MDRSVSKAYEVTPILQDSSFVIPSRAFWLVRGTNGGGKTTLAAETIQ